MRRVYGIGVDIVRIARVARLAELHGPRFLTKAFHPYEIQAYHQRLAQSPKRAAEFVASRWAVKEATQKAFASPRLLFPEICFVRPGDAAEDPRPRLQFFGGVKGEAAKRRIVAAHVSLSHDDGSAIAQVLLETDAPAQPGPHDDDR